MAVQRLVDRPQDPPDKVRAAIVELRTAYRDGRRILGKLGQRAELGERQMELWAEELGRTVDACRKIRQFVMLYTPDDLRELVDLCRQHGRAFGMSLLYKAVSIENRAARRKFQKDAIVGHWGHAQISRELRLRFGRRDEERGRKQRGRKPHVPQDVGEALVQIEDMARLLVRWQEHFAEMAEQGQIEQLPPAVSRNLRAAIKASQTLYESAARACGRSGR
jgi:hypothetical protein